MYTIPIAGYADRWSARPGESVEFKVSCLLEQPYFARLVRIICADPNPDGPGIQEEDLTSVFSGQFPSRVQDVQLGSYGIVSVGRRFPSANCYTVAARVWPTLLNNNPQGIMCLQKSDGSRLIELQINSEGQISGLLHEESNPSADIATGLALRERNWYQVWFTVDVENGRVVMGQSPVEVEYQRDKTVRVSYECEALPSLAETNELLIACSGGNPVSGFFNGKIECPVVLPGEMNEEFEFHCADSFISLWDFSKSIGTQKIKDAGSLKLDGKLVNCPARAMRGSNWTGREMCWRHAADEYGAIHFHDDDLYDCGWESDFSFTVPDGFRSGMYSMRIESADACEDIPFYVRPPTGRPQSKICVVVPTLTYTVYTNQARHNSGPDFDRLIQERGARPWNPDRIQTFGLSTYNKHHDGSGICYSSRLRPSLNMRPKYISMSEPYVGSGMRHLSADTHLFAWLEHLGYRYDLICDDDLHEEGYDLLEPYRVVMTPSHPEYHTGNTLDAFYEFSRSGGRLMYLGGNGFYWKVAVSDEMPGMVEIRRAEGGIRAWAAEPGEYYNSLDGGYGGLWLRNGRPPQKLTGVGFTGQGRFQGTYYRRNSELDENYLWVFEDVEDEIIGNFGLSGGGAAGFELDRMDYSLGTPENAVLLASSETYPDHFVLVPEEMLTHLATRTGEPVSKLIRADMVIFETPDGGNVFSVGSISYCGSLPWNDFDNNVSTITANVLNRFLEE